MKVIEEATAKGIVVSIWSKYDIYDDDKSLMMPLMKFYGDDDFDDDDYHDDYHYNDYDNDYDDHEGECWSL